MLQAIENDRYENEGKSFMNQLKKSIEGFPESFIANSKS